MPEIISSDLHTHLYGTTTDAIELDIRIMYQVLRKIRNILRHGNNSVVVHLRFKSAKLGQMGKLDVRSKVKSLTELCRWGPVDPVPLTFC